MLEKTYQPADIEARIHDRWHECRRLQGRPAGAPAGSGGPTRTAIVIPPPNVTGSLHMGHALNNTLQDVLCRFERMRGKDVLWQPGTDHAGIATQMVVERQLHGAAGSPTAARWAARRSSRRCGRGRTRAGGTIINQLQAPRRLLRLEPRALHHGRGPVASAVLKVFVDLYREGLIYKDKRLVNWDPKLQTAISDLEVEQIEVKGHLWHFRYPIEGSEHARAQYIVVATTRPETMLGDTGVAVHPEDERYQALIGKMVVLPLVGRADPDRRRRVLRSREGLRRGEDHAGPRLQRLRGRQAPRSSTLINIFDAARRGSNDERARDLSRASTASRRASASSPTWRRWASSRRSSRIATRCRTATARDVVIEPGSPTSGTSTPPSWRKPAIAAVEDGRTTFVPQNWEKTYFEWMRNIQPWCISRQLWWGHQIPAWYGPDGKIFVAPRARTSALARCAQAHYGRGVELRQRDEDVLDTWFSSALWPFSTLGWPDETPELKRFYPTSVLVTGFDIIFFWVARMMMMGLHFMDEVPFQRRLHPRPRARREGRRRCRRPRATSSTRWC